MLNRATIFLMLFFVWAIASLVSHMFTPFIVAMGLVVSLVVTVFVFRTAIIPSNVAFLFLQLGFYRYLFDKLSMNLTKVFKICLGFWNRRIEYTSILDYVFLNKDSDTEAVFVANLITILPGTIGFLVKKRYLIVHSLDKDYFSLSDMYNITNDASRLEDDSLI